MAGQAAGRPWQGRVVEVDGLANARDLGGLQRANGTTTPVGVFVRAEALDSVSELGWAQLRELGVRTVIDLRRPDERTASVPSDIALVTADLDGDEQPFWDAYEADGRWGTPLYYGAHLAELPHRLRAVLDAVSQAADGAVLFHCASGWDRTGLVSAVLLRALDVTTEAATWDYLESFANADAMMALHGRSSEAEERVGVLSRFGHTPGSAFGEMYESIDLDAWFDIAGAELATQTAVRTWRGAVASA